jgi:hypothetical protein
MRSIKFQEAFNHRFVNQSLDDEAITQICAYENRLLERIANLDEEVLRARFNINRQIIRLIKTPDAGATELAGFYILYPITEECENLISGGRIIKSSQIEDHQICQSDQAYAYYLSMVYGKDRAAQAWLIHLIFSELKAAVIENRRIQFIYVRPVTEAGFRVVEKHHFRKFRDDSGIYRRAVTSEDLV